MVKITLVLFWFGLFLVNINSVPAKTTDKIDLTKLDKKAFSSPKTSTGDILKKWKPSKTKPNPEELGEYYEGDILFPGVTRTGLINTSYRWPSNTIPYVLEGNFASDAIINIYAAINNYHANTCIRFVPRTNQMDYVAITNDGTGCWSSVGKVGGRQRVNLQYPGCTIKKGTIEHEFYHAAGFFHEHSRVDRDFYITVNILNVEAGKESNFNKVATSYASSWGVPYDHGSVMHYSNYAMSSNGQPTIVTRPVGIAIGQRVGLSARDFQKINKMYSCVKTATGWTG